MARYDMHLTTLCQRKTASKVKKMQFHHAFCETSINITLIKDLMYY